MSIFNCNLTFKMVEGDSLASTFNKLLAHNIIREDWSIISPAKARMAIQELNEEAKEVLGVNVNMFEEDGIKLFPNVDEFDRIDNLIATIKNVLFEGIFSKSLWRGQEQEPIINENGELVLIPTYDTLFRSDGISFATNKNLAKSYGNRYSKNPYIIEIDKEHISKIYPLGKSSQDYGKRVVGDEGEERFISKENIIIPKNKFKIYREDIRYDFSDKTTLFLMDELDKQSYETDIAEFNRYGEAGIGYSMNSSEYYKQIREELINRGFTDLDFLFISNNPITTTEEDIMSALNVEEWKKEYYKKYEEERIKLALEKNIQYQKLTEEEKNQTIAEAAKKAGSVNALHDLAARMADRIGGTVRFENRRDVDYKGYTQGNVSVINEAYADTSTVVHEILGHPIINVIRNVSDDTEQSFAGKVENVKTLYKNLLKELEYGKGKEILDKVRRDYQYKDTSQFYIRSYEENGVVSGYTVFSTLKQSSTFFKNLSEAEEFLKTKQTLQKYTLEEQQEEAIVELLGMYTANKLDAVKDKGLIALLKQLLKEMTAYLRSLFNSKEIEIEKLDASMTLDDLANLLAYSNSKLLLPNSTIKYTTPDNQTFKTYVEASKYISDLTKSVEDVDLSDVKINEFNNIPNEFETFGGIAFIKNGKYYLKELSPNFDEEGNFINEEENIIEISKERFVSQYKDSPDYHFYDENLSSFISKNKEYEQSKEIIEEWKKINNIVYNPEEVYSRGQEFVSVVGAYSNFDVNLMMQNLLVHIEDNQKAGGQFAISAITKPVDKKIGHLEGNGGKIRFKIYPKSEDILWASNIDVYSGSVWDASEKVNKDKKSELLGVSYTKYPSLENINAVQPNLANIIDDLAHHHNELGISLTGSNFRLEYDDNIPYSTKKIIDGINSILDQKYGKVVKPEIKKNVDNYFYVYDSETNKLIGKTKDKEVADIIIAAQYEWETGKDTYIKQYEKGSQPTQTNKTLKESIDSVKNRVVYSVPTVNGIESEDYVKYNKETKLYEAWNIDIGFLGDIFDTEKEANDFLGISNNKKEYTSQALINTKIAKLKEVAKKYPRSLIRSEVVAITNIQDIQYQKLPNKKIENNLLSNDYEMSPTDGLYDFTCAI